MLLACSASFDGDDSYLRWLDGHPDDFVLVRQLDFVILGVAERRETATA
jgi:hypothetical protein